MEVTISLDKTLEESAGVYFDRAKKLRKKTIGAKAALASAEEKLASADLMLQKEIALEKSRKPKQWFEKFRWFRTSEDFLVIGGRDAQTNEIVIKKHTEPGDLVFHTDMAGSPFFVIKSGGKTPGEASISEVADATASYSRAWKAGYAETQVFMVKPEQVSKTAKSGESLPRGAFMIYGDTKYIPNKMRLAVGTKDGQLMAGPVDAVKRHSDKMVLITQGDTKPSAAAKEIRKQIGGELDDIIRIIPAGSMKVRT